MYIEYKSWVLYKMISFCSQFMDLSNLVQTRVYYLLIGGLTCLGSQDGFPIVSVLMCAVTHWTGPTVNHDVWVLVIIIQQATILHRLSTL